MDIRELKSERAGIVTAMQEIHNVAEGENRSKTVEESQEFARLLVAEKDLRTRIDQAESMRELSELKITSAADAGIRGRDLTGALKGQIVQTDEYRSAFDAYVRRGLVEMSSEERAALRAGELRTDMTDGAATHGGYLVPTDFAKIVISLKVPAVAMRKTRATVFNTSNGQDLPVPVQSAYGAAAYLTEASALTSAADTGAKVTLKAYTAARSTAVSFQLMQDSAFDVQSLLAGNIANAFSLFEDPEFIKGAGSGSSAVTGVIGCTVGETTATGHLQNFTFDEVNAWYYSVGPAYRPQGEFILNDSLMTVLASLKDSNLRPIWTAGQIPGEPDTLLGKPLYTSPNFNAAGANAILGVFGDFANGYGIRNVGGLEIRRSDDRLIDQLETLFVSWERIDGNLLDASALRSLKASAT